MNIIRKSRASKTFSVTMAAVFLFSTINPTVSYGLSTGPGQPELEGFSPIGMDNMVDLFTGDFSYNLPLLNVPGPGGGYPINMSYSAGPHMEQEASWVGLGWTLNPGVVNREVRGLPDDFNGQEVTKHLTQKPNQTFGANIAAANLEAFGADAKKLGINSASINLFYNNYRGFSVQPGLGFSLRDAQERKSPNSASEKPPIDESSGEEGDPPSFPVKIKTNEAKEEKESIFANPKQSFASHYKNLSKNTKQNPGNLLSSAGARSVSDINYTHPMSSSSYTFNVKTGLVLFGVSGDLQVNAYFNQLKVSEKRRSVPAYGYMYSEHNFEEKDAGLMDFTLGNQSMLTPSSKILPVPNHTYDVFHVNSHGVNGTVRAYKGGVAKLVDPEVVSDKKNIGGGAELNSLAISNKVGVNLNGGGGKSYTGPWKDGDEAISFLNTSLEAIRATQPTLEPYYFKFANELTSQVNKNTIHVDEGASRFNLKTRMGVLAAEAKLTPSLQGSGTNNLTKSNAYRSGRERRAKSFQALTEVEARRFDENYVRKVTDVQNSTSYNVQFETSNAPEKDRIGAIHILDESGSRYIYGIPARNKLQKHTTFSTNAAYGGSISNLVAKSKSYTNQQNSVANSAGTDHFYSATETPEHAHSYLLTEILSEDYVDLGDDGPDKDDFGTYVKFNYLIKKDFKSKSPAVGADYLPGNLSNKADDKGTITYFEKDLYYLGSIETKTHIAVFELEQRNDAFGVTGENSPPSSSERQYRLKSITLYNLDDYDENGSSAKPIKTVHFRYNYSLGVSIPNAAASTGKLTLEKVWYTVGTEKTKMTLSPYEFTYANNFPYDETHVDRWGTYQHDTANVYGSNTLYPYTRQDTARANLYAGAWSLSQIKLPTGGKINITYESDDYQFVQNRRAQVMYEILGFTDSPSGNISTSLANNEWMIVKLPETIGSQVEANKYLSGLDQAYFRVFMKMKKFGQSSIAAPSSTPFSDGTFAYDFVDGYVDFQSGTPSLFDTDGEGLTNKIAVQLKSQHSSGYHPIRQAGWIDLQLSRSDLIDDSNFDLSGFQNFSSSVLGSVSSIIQKALAFLFDENSFYAKAFVKGWCSAINTSAGLKSIVRLNAPEKKIGGGHRVKRITISDEWAAMGGEESYTYGQDYFYEYKDGTSSGVAQYEPLTGGEENPFREPIRYSTDKLTFKNNDLYTELPVGEDFFPAASVGYARVVVKNLANDVVTTGGAGIQVHEFYTAKDYPVRTHFTPVKTVNDGVLAKMIKFIGNKRYFQPGFSQGFSIELNNMHGQKKSEATYSAYADYNSDAPVQKADYYYKTIGGYSPTKSNKLDSKVTVFIGDGISKEEKVGITQDTYVHLKESKESAVSGDIDGDLDITLPFAFVPTVWPNIDYAHTMTRTVVTNKVISKTGILEKVVTTRNGANTVHENLAYDHETGTPVVSSVTNDFGGRVFTYNQLAKWHYPALGGAYNNLGLLIEGPIDNYSSILMPGDMLMNESGNKLWVTERDPDGGAISLRKRDGTAVSSAEGYKLLRSGYQNKLNESVGYFETLRDPRELKGNLSIFWEYNDQVVGSSASSFTFTDTEYPITVTVEVLYYTTPITDAGGKVIGYDHHVQLADYDANQPYNYGGVQNNLYGSNPGYDLCIESYFKTTADYPDPNEFKLYYLGQKRMLALHADGYSVEHDYYEHCSCKEDPRACFGKYDGAVLGILNAGAADFADTLKLVSDIPSNIPSVDTVGISLNPYAYRMRGVYKPLRSYFFPESRNQTGSQYSFDTKIQEDGEYNQFYWFEPGSMNIGWIQSSEVMAYDHNGVAVEEKDALGNYSAVLYGYNRSLPIAVAKNAGYGEIAFDGFEDHEAGTFSSPDYDVNKRDNHLNFGSNVSLATMGDAHTGDFSLETTTSSTISITLDDSQGLELEPGKKYIIQAWHKAESGGSLSVEVSPDPAVTAQPVSPIIEGWQLLEIVFTAGSQNVLKIQGEGFQFDDFKLHPFNASFKGFVYNKYTHKLRAALDENHFATFYNYDRDQSLIQVKKETERGLKTIQSTYRVTSQGTVQ